MYGRDKIDTYKKLDVGTADKGKLVVMLYEGVVKFLNIAAENMNFATYDVVNENIQKASDIIDELRLALDFKAGGEIAQKLESIYVYILGRLQTANIEKSKTIVLEVKSYLEEMLESWKIAAKTNTASNSSGLNRGGFSLNG